MDDKDLEWDSITIDLSDINLNTTLTNDMAYTVTTPTSSTWLTGVTGASGGVYTVTGSNGASSNWADTITLNNDIKGASLKVHGDAEFDGDVMIGGKSIADSIDRIEERLAILRPNEELEEKWEQLRGLRKAYMELEAEIIEKEQIWGILKR